MAKKVNLSKKEKNYNIFIKATFDASRLIKAGLDLKNSKTLKNICHCLLENNRKI